MLNEVIAAALDFGYDGIELRGIGEDLFLPRAAVFGEKRLATSLNELKSSGLEVACISTDASCQISSPNPDVTSNLKEYIDLAVMVGAEALRILGDEWDVPGPDVDVELAHINLAKVLPYAAEKKVKLLLETSGIFANTDLTRQFIEQFDSPYVGVLWDFHHPFTYFGEKPAHSFANIGKYVGHVHVKDSSVSDGKVTYRMLGHGDLPIKEFLSLLKCSGYDRYLSLEWVKRWNSDLEDPGIVFPHYLKKMRKYLSNI